MEIKRKKVKLSKDDLIKEKKKKIEENNNVINK